MQCCNEDHAYRIAGDAGRDRNKGMGGHLGPQALLEKLLSLPGGQAIAGLVGRRVSSPAAGLAVEYT